jgi:hypothetical protein
MKIYKIFFLISSLNFGFLNLPFLKQGFQNDFLAFNFIEEGGNLIGMWQQQKKSAMVSESSVTHS